MGQVIFGLFLAAMTAATPMVVEQFLRARLPEAKEHDVVEWRRLAASPYVTWVLASWFLIAAISAAILAVQGRAIALGWAGVASLFAIAIVQRRRAGARILALLGDRGQVERSDRYLRRAQMSYRFAVVAFTSHIARSVLATVVGDDPADAATSVWTALTVLMFASAVGFAAVRVRMYLSGDDLKNPAPEER